MSRHPPAAGQFGDGRLYMVSRGGLLALSRAILVGGATLFAGGCVILPTIPRNIPGYDHTYVVENGDGVPVGSGWLLLNSDYLSGQPARSRCYPIESGTVKVPRAEDVRWGSRPLFYLIPLPQVGGFFPVYRAGFENPDATLIWPLVPGQLPPVRPRPDPDFDRWPHNWHWISVRGVGPPAVIRLVRADPESL